MIGILSTTATGTAPWWLDDFRPFTIVHLLVAITAAVVVVALVLGGRRAGRGGYEKPLRFSFAGVVIAIQTYTTVWWLLPENFDFGVSLPLHLCDIVAWLAPLTLLIRARWMRAALYFWGIGLSTQAFFTPILTEGVAETNFWLFWGGHTMILAAAVYDVVVLGYRPTGRDFLTVVVISLGYVGAMMVFNMAFDVNYGYVGDQLPARETALDLLGPWPWRVVAMVGLGTAAMGALWLVWPAASRLAPGRRGRGEAEAAGA